MSAPAAVHKPYTYQPVRNTLGFLPVDCWDLNAFDWSPLPDDEDGAKEKP